MCAVLFGALADNSLLAIAQETKAGATPREPAQSSPPVPGTPPADTPASTAASNPLGDAMALAGKGDYAAAIQKYQEVLQKNPKSPDAYAGIARCYLKKEDVKQARETVDKGLQVNDAWPVHVVLGEVYFRQGKIPEAEKEWVDVIKSGHQAARAYLGLARVRWALMMNKSARAMVEKAHEIDPRDPDIEKRWVETLPRAERIKYYEKYMADATLFDAEERRGLESYLTYLKEREKRHERPCRLVSKVKHTETPLVRLLIDPTHLRGYGLSVQLNGTGAKIMLDTGASGIVVKRSIAEKAGIVKLTETKIWGVGDKGRKNAYIGTADSIRIGDLEFQGCPVEVMEKGSVAGEDGLIGADVFENFLVELDFPDEKLKLNELPKRPGESDQQLVLKNEENDDFEESGTTDTAATPPEAGTKETAVPRKAPEPQDRFIAPEMQSFTRVYRFGHDLLVPTRIGDVPGKLFLLDTGALDNAISPEAAREVTKVHGDSDTIVKGISGSVKNVYSANKAVLQFGHLRQENQDMIAFDMSKISEYSGTEVAGFFGFVLLRFLDIKIDYRDALVDFSYDAKRFNR